MEGIQYIFVRHGDDVFDDERYAKITGAKRIIHQLELTAQLNAEIFLKGDKPHQIADATFHFTPGHTEGKMVMLWQSRYLLTGVHYAWLTILRLDLMQSESEFIAYLTT